MKIKQIEIKNFGKLNDFELSFGENQNIIYGNNEQGKSTIMAFIKAMFYGFSSPRNKDVFKDLRRKYLPWSGHNISGALEFDFEGKTYRIERSFGDTARKDTLRIINKSLNKSEDIPARDEPGRKYFDMSESSFEKSVFIGQIGSVIDLESDKENEIIKRLQNLASSGDETQSFSEVDANLQAVIEKIKSKSGRIGEYDKLTKAEGVLQDQRIDAIDMEELKLGMQNDYLELSEKRDNIGILLKDAENVLEEITRFDKFKRLSKIVQKSKEIDKLGDGLNIASSKLEKDGFVVTLEFIEELKNKLQSLQSEKSLILDKESEIKELQDKISAFDPSQQGVLSKDVYDSINSAVNLLSSLKEQKPNLEFKINSLENELRQGEQKQEEMNKLEIKQREYSKRLSDMEEQITKASADIADKSIKTTPKTTPNAFIAVAAALAVLSALGAMLIPFMPLYAVTLIFVISLIVRIAINRRDSKSAGLKECEQTAENSALQSSLTDNLNFVKSEKNEIESQIAKLSLEPGLTRSQEDYRNEIAKLRSDLADTNDSITQNETLLNENYMKYEVADFNSLQQKYMRASSADDQAASFREQLEQKNTQISILKQQNEENLKVFASLFAKIMTDGFFNPANLEEASEKVNEIVGLFYEVANSKKLYDDKQKDLRYELNGTALSVIKLEHYEMQQSYGSINMSEYEARLSELGNEELNSKMITLRDEFYSLDSKMIQLQTKMAHEFLGRKELSEIDEEIKTNKQLQEYYLYQHEALMAAKKALQDAFEDMQQSFGPVVNQKCASIFSQITGGKYQDIMVSKDLNISVREPFNNTTHEWKYLSNGTVDQVYFSLRLAISEIFTGSDGGLPIFLDDAFLQYDDDRAKNAMDFVGRYAKEKDTQVFMFTCHKSLLEFASSDARIIQI